MDLEQRALNAEKKLEKLEKLNSSMKTAIRRIVRTERDIKNVFGYPDRRKLFATYCTKSKRGRVRRTSN